MNDYLVVPKSGENFTISDVAEVAVKGDAVVFTSIGDVVGIAAIIPVSEIYGVFASKLADAIKAGFPGK